MKKTIIYSLLALMTAIGACKTDLDIKNPNLVEASAYWNTADEALKGVNAVYSTLHRAGLSRWLPFYYVIRSDEGTSVSPDANIVNNMQKFVVTDYNYGNAYAIWNDCYIGIFRANQVITYVPSINMDQSLKQRYIAEAKFMRAFFYYHLVTLWGNVPLMLSVSVTSDRPSTSAANKIWEQIENDLNDAAPSLPTSYGSADLGRATRGAAYALLAKVYMQQKDYTSALTPLHWLVEGDGKSIYTLTTDYRDNFLVTTENNKESVFEWQFAENPTETGDDDSATPNQNYGSSLAQFWAPPGIGWSDGEALRWPVQEFEKEKTVSGERDPRLAATYLFDSTDVRGPNYTMIYGQTFASRYGTSNNRIWFRKFLNDHWKNAEGYRSPNNWRYIRYADVLLMYAECLNATGSTNQAYQYVDRVRQRAGLTPLSTAKPGLSQPAFLEQLKHERLTELCGEGHRWEDLARWGDLSPALASRDAGFATFVVGKSELLPIPQQEIDLNPNLSQNPNW